MESLFLKSQGDNPRNRIWEFLIVFREYDYNIKDIAKNSKISYSSAKRLIKDFLKKAIVTQTRKIGNAKMYKLNAGSNIVKKFIDFFWAIVDSESELNKLWNSSNSKGLQNSKNFEKEEKTGINYSSTSPTAIGPVSAKPV